MESQLPSVPVYIPSKARAEKPKTADLLAESGVPFTVVVEPQDYDAYEAARPEYDYMVLPEDNRGSVYARNWIRDTATSTAQYSGFAQPWYWVMDDDIDSFYIAANGKTAKCAAVQAVRGAEGYFLGHSSLAQVGLEFQQYAWSATEAFVLNTACRVAMCFHAQRLRRIRYREEMVLKQDTDFSMQVLAAGWHTARITRYAFGTGKYGESKGGQEHAYAVPGIEDEMVSRLIALWPGFVKRIVKKDGRVDVKIDWRALAPK